MILDFNGVMFKMGRQTVPFGKDVWLWFIKVFLFEVDKCGESVISLKGTLIRFVPAAFLLISANTFDLKPYALLVIQIC